MQQKAQAFPIGEQLYPETMIIKTTLYELIEAISEEVEPAEDQLVTDVVLDLFDSGRIRCLNSKEEFSSSFVNNL
jgi:hypothetical protein